MGIAAEGCTASAQVGAIHNAVKLILSIFRLIPFPVYHSKERISQGFVNMRVVAKISEITVFQVRSKIFNFKSFFCDCVKYSIVFIQAVLYSISITILVGINVASSNCKFIVTARHLLIPLNMFF